MSQDPALAALFAGMAGATPTTAQAQAPAQVAGWADGVADAEAGNRGGLWFTAGLYVADIEVCKVIQKHAGGTAHVVEFTVIESDNQAHPAGAKRSWVRDLPGRNGMGQGDVKDFYHKILPGWVGRQGQTWTDAAFNAQILQVVAGPTNPLKGERVGLNAWDKPLKSDPEKSFTCMDWTGLAPGAVIGIKTVVPAPTPAVEAAPTWPAEPPAGWPAGLQYPPTTPGA